MITNIRYVLLTAIRDWLFIGLFIGVAVATSISAILGNTAIVEEREMTLAFASGSARLILMIGLIIFSCFNIRSAFDNKEIDVILSRPITRANLLFSYFFGFSLVGFLLAIPIIAIIAIIGVVNWIGFAVWTSSLLLEVTLVIAVALFFAFTIRSAVTAVLGCMGFYVLSRMMAFFMLTANSNIITESKLHFLSIPLKIVSTLMPRLDFFTKSEWLIYGIKSATEWHVFAFQSIIFVPLLLVASIIDFKRKQF